MAHKISIRLTISALFLLFVAYAYALCENDEFPCDDGTCIAEMNWCDGTEHCSDKSDEKYCKASKYWNKDPNKCNATKYFKCGDGPCIPKIGVCNGYPSCRDSTDEKNCQISPSGAVYNESSDPVNSPLIKQTTLNSTRLEDIVWKNNVNRHRTIYEECSNLPYLKAGLCHQRFLARAWLISQRKDDFGWDEETQRALIALYLSRGHSHDENESGILMAKQLSIRLSIALSRNQTKILTLTDISLYVNALRAICKNAKNFNGLDLISTLRKRVDVAHFSGRFVPPFVYLTLCINNVTTDVDVRRAHDLMHNKNFIDRTDMKALTVLAATCIDLHSKFKNIQLINVATRVLQETNRRFIPGNIYEAALLVQALNEVSVDDFKQKASEITDYILTQQQENGSFGDILATYYVLPILSERSLLSLKEPCDNSSATDLTPIEVLKNTKRQRNYVHYSIYYGNPVETTQSLTMFVPEKTAFFDIMRLAQDKNPNFRFELDSNKNTPTVYSIGGIPNDAERGLYWTLHVGARKTNEDKDRLKPFPGSIKTFIPSAGDEMVFWMQSITI